MDPNKRNIKAIRLRGEQSDGLILPIECLSKYVNIESLNDGDQITVLNGKEICKKYIPIRKQKTVNNSKLPVIKVKKESYPYFKEHSDTAQLAYNEHVFKEGDTCYITLKMHGTSARTANTIENIKPNFIQRLFRINTSKYKYISGTRRTILKIGNDGWYGDNEFRRKYHKLFEGKLPKGMEVFYEIVGWANNETPIMQRCSNELLKDKEFVKKYGDETIFSYGCEVGENDCYVYRMTMTNPDGYIVELPWEQVQLECEKMGVKCVPTYEKFIYTTWEDLMERVEKYYDGTDPIGKVHIKEGVVVRIDNREKFTAYKHKNFEFKVLEGIIKDTADSPDMEEMEDVNE